MRSVVIFLLLVFVTNVCIDQISYASSAPTNATADSIQPYVDVVGGVQKPGRYHWLQGMTVVDAINASGGFLDPTKHIAIIIHSDGKREKFNADTFPYGEKKPPLLKAGDVVSVSKRIV